MIERTYTKIDELFRVQERERERLRILQGHEEITRTGLTNLDDEISQIAAEQILKVVADPNNPEVYGKPSIDYATILTRVLEEVPRFTSINVGEGVTRLLNAGRIECKTGEYTVYRLPEEKKK